MPKCFPLKNSINQAHLQNGTYKQIVSHLERELELNGSEAPDDMQIITVTQQASQENSENPKSTCHHCKKAGHYRNQCRQLKREKDQIRNITNSAENNNNNNGSAQTNSNSTSKVFKNTNANNVNVRETEDLDLCTHPVRPLMQLTTPQTSVNLEQTQRTDRLPGMKGRKDKTKSNREMPKATQMGMSKLQPKL